jgi:heat shock protein HslJ
MNRVIRWARLVVMLVVVTAAMACQTPGETTSPADGGDRTGAPGGEPGPPPSLGEVASATYRGLEGAAGAVTLVDGRWQGEPLAPGAASRPVVELVRDFLLEGDLDGDGDAEAVVGLSSSSGGSGTFLHLAVVDRRGGRVENVATALLGNRVQVRGVKVDGGRLVVDLVQAGPQDAMCCPGELVTRTYALGAGGLEEPAAAAPTGRLGLDALEGVEWVLRRWAWDEPAPSEPEVTLRLEGGRISGGNGCNRYFAEATAGESPGDVTLGTAGATKMFCPDPAGAVETRFMSQLAGVTKYGFMMGRLALSYEVDGEHGTMLFDPRALSGESTP